MTRCASAPDKLNPPLAQHLADRRLVREISSVLEATGQKSLGKCDVSVHAGVAVLAGRVPTLHLKRLAQESALEVEGVARVENELRVTPRSP